MIPKAIKENVFYVGAMDWDYRGPGFLYQSPEGTSYNSFFIKGKEKNALIDSVSSSKKELLFEQLKGVEKIDYIVVQHVEQDRSGALWALLQSYPQAKVLCTEKSKQMLLDLITTDASRFEPIEDSQTVALGGKSMQFFETPWVHWPETMCTYIPQDQILFTCDLFGSHIASTELYAYDRLRVYQEAKLYYAQVMMPFRHIIKKHIEFFDRLKIKIIAPGHGPVHNDPQFILYAYKNWIDDFPSNMVTVPYVSMHGNTKKMTEYLVKAISDYNIHVQQFDMAVTDIWKIAVSLVDASAVIMGVPTIHLAPHPAIATLSFLINSLRPKLLFASVFGSYGWNTRAVDSIVSFLPDLNFELLSPVMCKGVPNDYTFKQLDDLAQQLAEKHVEANLL
ncbi:FprA family A-type flavoprotein [Chitinispirillales bacterium ANBcel5]|uniref:FprA family A-type flavoprotein n=1 Tax=Cellulosispirillum alkaliphilum TaxID=3039283 RepID=UPI002A528C64|nr:FprA family A-type flavoprotein [Chitinispirillales bacterium ANBcel5]